MAHGARVTHCHPHLLAIAPASANLYEEGYLLFGAMSRESNSLPDSVSPAEEGGGGGGEAIGERSSIMAVRRPEWGAGAGRQRLMCNPL